MRKTLIALTVCCSLVVGFVVVVVAIVAAASGSAACGSLGLDGPPGSIRVMTWNLWGDAGDRAGHPLKDRAAGIVGVVQGVAPDLFLAQEASSHADGPWLQKYVQKNTGLAPVGAAKSGRKIWYNPARFDPAGSGYWNFPMGTLKKGAAWAKLTDHDTGGNFYVVSVHLDHFKPNNSLRARQTRWLLSKVKAMNTRDLPVIIGGDMNTDEHRASGNAPIGIFKNAGYINTRDNPTQPAQNTDIGSAIGDRILENEPKVTHPGPGNDLDWIFASGSSSNWWSLVPQAPIVDGHYSASNSNHNPIAAGVTLPASSGFTLPNAAKVPTSIPGTASASTAASSANPSPWSSSQLAVAQKIVAAGKAAGVDDRGQTIALMTAIGESTLNPNARNGIHIGLFQQAPSWGTTAERLDPTASASAFYRALKAVPGWEAMTPTQAAYRVQRNGNPTFYTKFWTQASDLFAKVSGQAGSPDDAVAGEGCPGASEDPAWATGQDCGFTGVKNPRTCQQALAAAAKIAHDQPCTNVVRGGTWDNRCLEFVGRVYGYYAAGTATAYDHYLLLKRMGKISTSRDIPAGALVFFTTSSPAGHVAIYAGKGQAYSNDFIRNGCIDLTPMTTLNRGARFLGWSPPIFPHGSPLHQ